MRKAREHNKKRGFVFWGGGICLALCLCFVVTIVANATNKLSDSDSFGIGRHRFSINAPVGVLSSDEFQSAEDFEASQTMLAEFSTRDISTALSSVGSKIEERNRLIEAQRQAALMAKINELKNKENEFIRSGSWPNPNLSIINYDAGKDAFVQWWGERINAYLAGSPLYGQGAIFADAAWEEGVDPRWSPAISNTESSKGLYCFAPFNAWGWGDGGWASWEEAIRAHVHGLSEGYAYSITVPCAEKYCPPNSDNWFHNTLSEMLRIG